MNLLDYLLIAVIAISVITAALKGLAYEVLMMGATVAGVALAASKYPVVAEWLRGSIANEEGRNLLAFVTIFLGCVILGAVAGKVAGRLLKAAGLRWADRLLGAGFGLVRGVLIAAVLLLAFTAFPLNTGLVANSRLAPGMIWSSRAVAAAMPNGLEKRFKTGWARVRHQAEMAAAKAKPVAP